MMLNELTDDNIDMILGGDRTCIFLFYSPIMPNTPNVIGVFEQFNCRFQGKIDVYICDIEKEKKKIQKYFKTPVLPAMVMLKNNNVYANIAGPVSTSSYENSIKQGIQKIINEN